MRNESGFDFYQLPMHLQNMIDEELETDEEIVWMSQPSPRRFMLTAIPIVLFAIPWTAFSIFWMAGASGFKVPDFSKPDSFFMLFGLPFVFIGLGMLSSPFWIARKAKKTVYLITDQRALILDGGWSTTIRSYKPRQLTGITRRQKSDGSGDLIFDQKVSYDSDGDRRKTDIGFQGIQDVKRVHSLIEELVEEHSWSEKPTE